MSRPLVYVAGAISAPTQWEREQNVRRAEAVALEAWKAGAAAICVHAMTRSYCDKDVPYETWLAGDLAILARCDALLTVPGWEASPGARREVGEAFRLGLAVMHSPAELVAQLDWLAYLARRCVDAIHAEPS